MCSVACSLVRIGTPGPPHPLSHKRVWTSPGNQRGGTPSPAGEGLGVSQFGRMEKKPSTLSTLWLWPLPVVFHFRTRYEPGFFGDCGSKSRLFLHLKKLNRVRRQSDKNFCILFLVPNKPVKGGAHSARLDFHRKNLWNFVHSKYFCFFKGAWIRIWIADPGSRIQGPIKRVQKRKVWSIVFIKNGIQKNGFLNRANLDHVKCDVSGLKRMRFIRILPWDRLSRRR